MTAKRTPAIDGDTFAPEMTDAELAVIVAACGLPVIEERIWLRRELRACGIYYAAQLAYDTKHATGQKSRDAWHEYISDLARIFERAFGERPTGTIYRDKSKPGRFIRFALAALAQIGVNGISADMIRDTLRQKTPTRGE